MEEGTSAQNATSYTSAREIQARNAGFKPDAAGGFGRLQPHQATEVAAASLGTTFPGRKAWCGRWDEFIPSSVEGNRHVACAALELKPTFGKLSLLAVTPSLQLPLSPRGRRSVFVGLEPNQGHWFGALGVAGAFARLVVEQPLTQIRSDAAVAGAIETNQHVAAPAGRYGRIRALRLAALAQGKISWPEILVRKVGFEPTRLTAPPPQDGASASSATSAQEGDKKILAATRGRRKSLPPRHRSATFWRAAEATGTAAQGLPAQAAAAAQESPAASAVLARAWRTARAPSSPPGHAAPGAGPARWR